MTEEQCPPVTKQVCEKIHYMVKCRDVTTQECNHVPNEHYLDVVDRQCHTKYMELTENLALRASWRS